MDKIIAHLIYLLSVKFARFVLRKESHKNRACSRVERRFSSFFGAVMSGEEVAGYQP